MGIVMVVAILVAIGLTRSRSPVLYLGAATIVTLLLSTLTRTYIYLALGGPAVILAYFFLPGAQGVGLAVANIFATNVGENQYGSSIAMRLEQLAVATRYFLQSPIIGNGMDATRSLVASGFEPGLYNSESLVYSVMINQGVLGFLAYGFLFASAVWLATKSIPARNARAITIGLVAGYIIFVFSTGVMETLSFFFPCIRRSFSDGNR